MQSTQIRSFQRNILTWYRKNKRDDLLWRWTKKWPVEPYHILVSEIMLQQTQVSRALEKYPLFLKQFPTVQKLADAPLPDLLRVWQGMGYNRRAIYLKRCAEVIVKDYGGNFPHDPKLLQKLPGIGPYTAGAVACFAFNKPVVFMDTNIRKTFLHFFFSRKTDKKITDNDIVSIAQKTLWHRNPRRWNYALMDYGALELSRKNDLLHRAKSYHKQSPFSGSPRFYRSQILKYLLAHNQATEVELKKLSPLDVTPLLASLTRDGLIEQVSAHQYRIAKI